MSTAEQLADTTPIKESANEDSHDVELTPFTIFRYVASIALLIFSVIIVGALIFTGNTRVASETNSWVALIVTVSICDCDAWSTAPILHLSATDNLLRIFDCNRSSPLSGFP